MKFLLAIALAVSPCFGVTIFSDNFDTSLAATQFNATITGWTATNGTIDYLKNGDFGIGCLGGTGGCIDLDGSSFDAADFTSSPALNLIAGRTYTLTYSISGNQRSGSDNLVVSFGGQSNTHTNVASSAPYTQYSIVVTPLANTSSSIVFAHAGGDNLGIILDNVSVDEATGSGAVPEPSSAALLLVGLTAAFVIRRRS